MYEDKKEGDVFEHEGVVLKAVDSSATHQPLCCFDCYFDTFNCKIGCYGVFFVKLDEEDLRT